MGTLRYGSHEIAAIFDDRFLAHAQIVLTAKMRRGEGFFFTWVDTVEHGSGRSSLWISPNVSLEVHYSSTQREPVSRQWVELLTVSANSRDGLTTLPEPVAVGQVR